jgi:hypothetical protein
MSKILMKHINRIFEISFLEIESGTRSSAILEEMNAVVACSPIKTIINKTTLRIVETPHIAARLSSIPERAPERKVKAPVKQMKKAIIHLLKTILNSALLVSFLIFSSMFTI